MAHRSPVLTINIDVFPVCHSLEDINVKNIWFDSYPYKKLNTSKKGTFTYIYNTYILYITCLVNRNLNLFNCSVVECPGFCGKHRYANAHLPTQIQLWKWLTHQYTSTKYKWIELYIHTKYNIYTCICMYVLYLHLNI